MSSHNTSSDTDDIMTESLIDITTPPATTAAASAPFVSDAVKESADDGATDFKKRKQTSSSTASSTSVDFSFLNDQLLPPVEDEEIVETGSYTWEISNYKELTDDKVHSPSFSVGGWDWNILLFPKGNANNNVALYLEPLPKKHKQNESDEEETPVDPEWYVCAQFTLIVSNPNDPKNCIVNTSHQRFNQHATDWGFSNFLDIRTLVQTRKENGGPLLADDRLNITAFVKVLKDPTGVLWHNFLDYDSKKETGYVGFRNQGATCYLNSLLQSYFFTKSFRKAVYQIPTNNENPTESVPLALQRIFYQLQRSDDALDTSELTQSFGWDNADAFTQHDVQELNRVLMDKLEARMKGTSVEGFLNETFVGKMKSYIKCINVDYESSRDEDFWDIQLNVKNLSNLNQSFQNYIENEIMDGENQYAAPDYGLQDAKKGVIFTNFPNVLHLQLKRFEYDFDYDALVKINDRYEFPESIDLSSYLEHEPNSLAEPLIYDLHGVLVHAGDISTGHYYTLIKPDKDGQWYKFDDERVTRVTRRQVFDENFGIDALDISKLQRMTRVQQASYQIRRHTSAYMLVYIKRSESSRVLEDVSEADVPEFISSAVNKELEERAREKKEKEELHLYLNMYIYTDKLFKNYEGFDLGADSRAHAKGPYKDEDHPIKIKALKNAKFTDLFDEIQEKTGVDPNKVTFWGMTYRRNQTLRPSAKLTEFRDMTVEEVYQKGFSKRHSYMNIWLEDPEYDVFRDVPSDLRPIEKIDVDENENLIESTQLLLFLKYFDVDNQKVKGIGHMYVSEEDTIESILPAVRSILNLKEDQAMEVYEELNPGNVDPFNVSTTFYKAELGNGDIICVQKAVPTQQDELIEINDDLYPYYPSADQFYAFLATRVHIKVQPLRESTIDQEYVVPSETSKSLNSTEGIFETWISSHATYDELATRIGKKINKDPKKLKIYSNFGGHRTPLRMNMLVGNYFSSSIPPLLEYEVLNISLKELENMKSIKIHWLPNGYCHYTDYEFLIPKTGTVSDLIDKMQAKIGFDEKKKESVLIWTNMNFKFGQILYPAIEIQSVDNSVDIYAAILPEETKVLNEFYNVDPDSISDQNIPSPLLVPVLQFYRDPRNLHGIAFVFALYPNEDLKTLKERLQKKLGLGQKEFTKVQICVWDLHNRVPNRVDDDQIVIFDEFSDQDYLCLDHPDRTSRSGNYQGGGISIRG